MLKISFYPTRLKGTTYYQFSVTTATSVILLLVFIPHAITSSDVHVPNLTNSIFKMLMMN